MDSLLSYSHADSVSCWAGSLSKAQVLEGLSQKALGLGWIPDQKAFLKELQNREALMSTGLGQELGVPHVRSSQVKKAFWALGLVPSGVRGYDSLDGGPIRVVVLIGAPEQEHNLYLQILARLTLVLKQPSNRRDLLALSQPAQVWDWLQKHL